jgi:hypothetical protein
MEVPATRLGGVTDEGWPTASSTDGSTCSAERTLADRATVPVLDDAEDPAAGSGDAPAEPGVDGLPASLITTMVATMASTSPTGTSAAATGCRDRNLATREAREAGGSCWARRRAAPR